MIYVSYWIRELFGWLLVALGLAIFGLSLLMLLQNPPRIITAGPVIVVGIFVFRGGIHLLKVAVAARICLHAQKSMEQTDTPKKPLVNFKKIS